jgi:hypothetical protein
MKKLSWTLAAFVTLLSFSALGTQTAQVRMYCLSVKLNTVEDEYGDRLAITSTGGSDGLGELLAGQNAGSDLQLPTTQAYSSSISLFDIGTGITYGGGIYVDIAPAADDNNNRFPDFFDISMPVSYVWMYAEVDIYGYGNLFSVPVTWTRAAGSRTGTCSIAMGDVDSYWGTFNHTFEILDYTGTLTYTPGSNVVTGTINMTQTGNPSVTVQGPIQFTKVSTDPYNQLTNQPGSWTGALLSTVHSFTNHWFSRDVAFPTNYAGFIEFSDGDPTTFKPYATWVLSITDTNDTNRNGIPDFSDDPVVVPPARRPSLSLARGSGNLLLTIAGDVGHVHPIQETPSLSSPSWNTVQTVTLSSDPQTVTLALPTSTKFWRVVAQ